MRFQPVVLSFTVALLTAFAGTASMAADVDKAVAQKDGWAGYAKQLGDKVASVNQKCGSTLTPAYDKSSYTEFDPIKDRTQAACHSGVDALAAVCSSDAGKATVKNLKSASCRFSNNGTGVSAQGQTLLINIDPAKSSIAGKQPGSYTWASAIKEIL